MAKFIEDNGDPENPCSAAYNPEAGHDPARAEEQETNGTRRTMDLELRAMNSCLRILEDLEPEEQQRALRWLVSRLDRRFVSIVENDGTP